MPLARALLVCSALLAACSGGGATSSSSAGPRVAQASGEDLVCSRDEDCALVDDCCGCAAGGTKHAVRADRVPTLEQQAESECAAAQCTGMASEHRSCDAVGARCAGGRCIPRL